MATITKHFDAYKLWYNSGHPYEAHIYCYAGTAYMGRIVFFKDDAVIPANANYGGNPSIHYPLSRFDHVISILRYEKPLYLFLNLDNLIGHLATAEREPTGEEES